MTKTMFRLLLLQIQGLTVPRMSPGVIATRAQQVNKDIDINDVRNWISGRAFPPFADRTRIIEVLEKETRR